MTTPAITRRAFGGLMAGGAAMALAGCSQGRFDASGYPRWLVSGFSVLETNPARIGALTDYENFIGKDVGIPLRSFRAAGYSGVSLAMMNNQTLIAMGSPGEILTEANLRELYDVNTRVMSFPVDAYQEMKQIIAVSTIESINDHSVGRGFQWR